MNPETDSWPSQEPISPMKSYFWPLDNQLRKEAMDDALSIFHHFDNKQKYNAAQIVSEAEIIYNFLKG